MKDMKIGCRNIWFVRKKKKTNTNTATAHAPDMCKPCHRPFNSLYDQLNVRMWSKIML
jgi:hypothetical protein